jgi:hypothetical protein
VSSRRDQVDRRLVVIVAALIASVIGIAAGFALAVHVDDTVSVGSGPAAPPQTKGVVSGTLVLTGGPTQPTPVAGDVHIVNVLQTGGGQAYLPGVATAADGSFSEIVDPGLYEVSGTSPVYWGGRRSCKIPGQTVRIRAGDAVSVNVECRTR